MRDRFRRGINSSQASPASSSHLESWKSFTKGLLQTKINFVIVVAFILFAAGSVSAMALVAYSEISIAQYDPIVSSAQQKSNGQVLAAASFGYNQPVCNDGFCLNYHLQEGNTNGTNGLYAAKIDYTLPFWVRNGAVRENGELLARDLSGSNTLYTRYVLKPNTSYTYTLYYNQNSSRERAKIQFTTPSATPTSTCSYAEPAGDCSYVAGANYNSSTFCGLVLTCPTTPTPTTPSYGYQLPNNGSSSSYYAEGWVELFSKDTPNRLAVSGWVYDNDKSVNVEVIVYNETNGQKYSFSGSPTRTRSDISSYLSRKFNIGKVIVPTNFIFATNYNLPDGVYKIIEAKFNGYTMYINGIAQRSITIGSPASQNKEIIIRAKGTPVNGVYPRMSLKYGDQILANWTVTNTSKDYNVSTSYDLKGHNLSVHFTNDAWNKTQDRNLFVDYIKVNGKVYQSEDSSVYSKGSWDSKAGCGLGYKESEWLHCSGYFEYQTKQGQVITNPTPIKPPQVTPPDFSVEAMTVSPKVANATNAVGLNKEVSITYTVKNNGGASAMPIFSISHLKNLSPRLMNDKVTENTCGNLTRFAANSSCTYAINVVYDKVSTADSYASVELKIDPNNLIAESKESNNWGIVDFDVRDVSSTPKLQSLSSDFGKVGNKINIIGSDLILAGKTTKVKFGSKKADFALGTGDSIQAVVVPNLPAGVYKITVEVGSYVTNSLNFKVLPPRPQAKNNIIIRAKGTPVNGGYPKMTLTVGGRVLGSWTVTSSLRNYSVSTILNVSKENLKVNFINDAFKSGQDRNLFVDYIKVNGKVYQSEDSSVYSKGSWDSKTKCGLGYKKSEWLNCSGYFEYQTGSKKQASDNSVNVVISGKHPSKGSTVISSIVKGTIIGRFKIQNKGKTSVTITNVKFTDSGSNSTNLDRYTLTATAQGSNAGIDVIAASGKTSVAFGQLDNSFSLNGGAFRYLDVKISGGVAKLSSGDSFKLSVAALGDVTYSATEVNLGYDGNGDGDISDTIGGLYTSGLPELGVIQKK